MSDQNKPVNQDHNYSVQIKQTHITGEIFHSDYPSPDMLKKYAEIDPSYPDRLLNIAEEESRHRHKLERQVTGWSIFLDVLGTVFAPAVVAGILLVGYLFMKENNASEGAWIIGTVTVALAITFLTRGKRTKNPK